MPTKLFATDTDNLEAAILRSVRSSGSSALGLAIAYVSIYGVHFLKDVKDKCGVEEIRLITDIGDAITHPQALRFALADGWKIKTANPGTGTFHPKFVIGGRRFDNEAGMEEAALLLIGSANLTKGGLRTNVECALVRTQEAPMPAASSLFKRIWSLGEELTEGAVEAYEIEFAARNRARPAKDLEVLGVADEAAVEVADPTELRQRRAPSE
jgi:HKD family nuclease